MDPEYRFSTTSCIRPSGIREFGVPVYGTRLTLGGVRSKLEEFGIKKAAEVYYSPVHDVHVFGHETAEKRLTDRAELRKSNAGT